MRRRDFIKVIAGSTALLPFAVGAQQSERKRQVGILMGLAADDPEAQDRIGVFEDTLHLLGWTEGRNLQIDYRRGAGNTDVTRKYAAELIALAPDVILASGGTVVGPLLQATRSVPIVFTQTPDPVAAGFVASLARPGGNATGFTTSEYGISAKWLELLKEIAPGVTRVAVLRDATIPSGVGQFTSIQSVAPSFGVELSPLDVRDPNEIEQDLTAFARESNRALIVTSSSAFTCHRRAVSIAGRSGLSRRPLLKSQCMTMSSSRRLQS